MSTKIWLLSASNCSPVAFMHKPTLPDLLKYASHNHINIRRDYSELDQEFLDTLLKTSTYCYTTSEYRDVVMRLKQIDLAENTSPMGEL